MLTSTHCVITPHLQPQPPYVHSYHSISSTMMPKTNCRQYKQPKKEYFPIIIKTGQKSQTHFGGNWNGQWRPQSMIKPQFTRNINSGFPKIHMIICYFCFVQMVDPNYAWGSNSRGVSLEAWADKVAHLFMLKIMIWYTPPLQSPKGGGMEVLVDNASKIYKARSFGNWNLLRHLFGETLVYL